MPRNLLYSVSIVPFVPLVLCLATIANTHAQDSATDLREAARAGDAKKVTELLDAGTPIDSPARHNVTALRLAAERGQLDVVKLLVERGADIDADETFFNSSIVAAALRSKQREIAKLLLEKNALDRAGALNWAIDEGDLEIAKAALEGEGVEPLDLAVARKAASEKSKELKELLEKATGKRVNPSGKEHPSLALPIEGTEQKEGREKKEQPGVARSGDEPQRQEKKFSPERLKAFAGKYRDKDLVVEVSVRGEKLAVAIGDAEPIELEAVRDRRFENEAGDLRFEIGGRAGTIEWASLVRANGDVNFLSSANSPELETLKPAAEISLKSAPRGETKSWRQFRGAGASGIGDGQGVTADWDVAAGRNIRFKTPIPGIATASPIIDSGKIFVTTAVSSKGDTTFRTGLYGDGTSVEDTSEHSFRLYALNSSDGAIAWEREVANVAPTVRRHLKSSLANSTPATDGERIVVLFGMIGILAAYDREGNELWTRDIGVLDSNDPQSGSAEWGHASSPVIWEDLVIVQADRRRDSFLAAYQISSGEVVWNIPRDEASTWSTPTIVPSPSGDELVTNGTTVRAYRPRSGELLWSLGPNSEVVVATPVAAEAMVYVTAGYPPVRPVYAIRTGSRGDLTLPTGVSSSPAVAWSHLKGGTYLPTPIMYRGHMVTINNNGVVTSYRVDSGEEVHRARVAGSGKSFSSSPVAADGRIYVASEDGEVFVLRGEPGYELLATNPMGEVVMATPAISDGLLVIRTLGHVVGIAEDETTGK